ncbi:hypothetical protein [Metallibacterium sp.]|nr:hypothetical protein [Metallibacterium sp.]
MGTTMQRWIKLPDGRFLDAARVVLIGKPETFQRLDEEGNDLGTAVTVTLGVDSVREHQLSVTGAREEMAALLKTIVGAAGNGGA